MSMFSNEAVKVEEAAFASFNDGEMFTDAFAEYKDTMFETIWLNAWAAKESEYEAEYTNWLNERDAESWNSDAEAAFWANEAEIGVNVYAV